MAIRFRKSVKLAPGIRMNLSGSGVSWTLGPKGASIGIGKRGTYLNTGIPGTGFYSRQALRTPNDSSFRSSSARSPTYTNVKLAISVSGDGTVAFEDENGQPAPEWLIAQAKKQRGDSIRDLIQEKCDQINAQMAALGELHHDTPSPNKAPEYQPQPFSVPRPALPISRVPGFFERIFKASRIKAENARAKIDYEADLQKWDAEFTAFEAAEKKKQDFVARAVGGDVEAMEAFFGEVLLDIVWPRETLVSFEIRNSGSRLCFDVDLPEVEDIPNKTATVPSRGYKLNVKDLGPTAVQKLYAQHVHSIAFRLLGEAFAMLPTVQEVALSGYSQRKNRATGHEADEYLLSVVVSRASWQELNFSDLPSIDVVEALARFELRRTMTKTGIFSPVQPF